MSQLVTKATWGLTAISLVAAGVFYFDDPAAPAMLATVSNHITREAHAQVDASPPSAEAEDDSMKCLGDARLGPFSGSGDCVPGVPSPEVAKLAHDRDEEDLIRGFTSQSAIDVLRADPLAPLEAYENFTRCKSETELSEKRATECRELFDVMPYTLIGLRQLSEEGNGKASMELADYYLGLMLGAAPSARDVYKQRFDRFLGAAKAYDPARTVAMEAEMKRIVEGNVGVGLGEADQQDASPR